MLECFGRGPIGDPLLLELVEVLCALKDDDDCSQTTGDPDWTAEPCDHRQSRSNHKLKKFQLLEPSLILLTLVAIPANLGLQPLPGRVLLDMRRHSFDRSNQSDTILVQTHPYISSAGLFSPNHRLLATDAAT